MAKTYSDEEMLFYSKNPKVLFVARNKMALTLEFKKELYAAWLKNPRPATIKKMLADNGFNVRSLDINFYKNIALAFRRSGEPTFSKSPTRHDKDVIYGVSYDSEKSFYPSSAAERSVSEQSSENDSSGYIPERVDELKKNPFVEKVTASELRFSQPFYDSAAILTALPADDILDIYRISPSLITNKEKSVMLCRLSKTDPVSAGAFAESSLLSDTAFLSRRMAALEKIIETGYQKLSSQFPSMSHIQKKRLCLWIASLPPDPEHKYTRKSVLQRIGITRSVYYRYVSEEDFGLGEARKKEQDDRDAETIRMVLEYKGFRKGSRQIYMLMPRITEKKMSIKKIRRLMKTYGMKSGVRGPNEARRAAQARITETTKPNLLRRMFRLHRPNEVRVTDVTYLDYGDHLRAYGSALMDPVTGRLFAFVISENNDVSLTLDTLHALDSYPCTDGGIFHSDQGTLYRTEQFQKEILERGLRQSMSKRGNCWDNATQESFFGHFKDECDCSACRDIAELKELVREYQYYYNNERGMWDRGRMTPVEYESYLLSLNEEEFETYLLKEEEKYNAMKERAAALAKKRYGTLGV